MDRAIQKLADASGSTVKEVLPSQMRLFATDLAMNTKPIGKDSGGQKKGQAEVEKRILSIYMTVGAAVEALRKSDEKSAHALIRMIRQKKFSEAGGMLSRLLGGSISVGPFDGGELHKSQAFSRRISKRRVVTDFPKVNAYIREKKKLVGYAKGGFATAARQLGGVRGIPGYATRQNSPGAGSVSGDGKTLTVTMTNDVRHIREALDAGGEARATAFRTKQINSVLERMMTRKSKSVSRSLK